MFGELSQLRTTISGVNKMDIRGFDCSSVDLEELEQHEKEEEINEFIDDIIDSFVIKRLEELKYSLTFFQKAVEKGETTLVTRYKIREILKKFQVEGPTKDKERNIDITEEEDEILMDEWVQGYRDLEDEIQENND